MPRVIKQDGIKSLPITIDPNVLSGVPVFLGTRVPIDALFSNLEAGVSIDEFVDNFPTVSREQALTIIRFAHTTLNHLLE